jgi:hypothetical protein
LILYDDRKETLHCIHISQRQQMLKSSLSPMALPQD